MHITVDTDEPVIKQPFAMIERYMVIRGGPNDTILRIDVAALHAAEASRIADAVQYVWRWSAADKQWREGKRHPSPRDFKFAFDVTTVVDHR